MTNNSMDNYDLIPKGVLPFKAKNDESSPDYVKTYKQFWADLVETDGLLDMDKVMRELADYKIVMDNVTHVYDEITMGRISKPHSIPSAVISAANEVSNRHLARDIFEYLLDDIEDGKAREIVVQYARELDPQVDLSYGK